MSDEAVRRAWRKWRMDQTPENAQAWALAQSRTMSPPEDINVDELDLPVRARKALERLGVRTTKQVAEHTVCELLGQKNCGPVTVNAISRALQARGFDFKGCPTHDH